MVLHRLARRAESNREEPRLGNTDGTTQVPRSFTMTCDLVWEWVWTRKVCQGRSLV